MYENLRLLTEAGSVQGMADLLMEMMDRFWRQVDRAELPMEDRLFRIHWDGDFFSEDYAVAWGAVMLQFPAIQFWAYTRSFVDPVNVVPFLSQVPNLALYLSADRWNVDAARLLVAEYPDVKLALCTEDYETGRLLAGDRPYLVCPENSEKMPLVSRNGVGACVSCRLCPESKRDVIFSVSHRERQSDTRLEAEMSAKELIGVCAATNCENPVYRLKGKGRKPKWCSKQCRWDMYTASRKARSTIAS